MIKSYWTDFRISGPRSHIFSTVWAYLNDLTLVDYSFFTYKRKSMENAVSTYYTLYNITQINSSQVNLKFHLGWKATDHHCGIYSVTLRDKTLSAFWVNQELGYLKICTSLLKTSTDTSKLGILIPRQLLGIMLATFTMDHYPS